MTPWEIEGRELVNCTCEYGCNCQFNALPDKGHCHAVAGILIDRGRHGSTKLDGLRIAAIFKWPGPIHEGNGEAIAFVDVNADATQRDALLRIMTGQDTDPFATMFAVYASTVTKMNDPVFTKIDLDLDIDGRRARIFVKDYIDTVGEPIRNKDDREIAQFMRPPLTTVVLPHFEMGLQAAELLIDGQLRPEGRQPQVKVDCPLVERASVAAPPR